MKKIFYYVLAVVCTSSVLNAQQPAIDLGLALDKSEFYQQVIAYAIDVANEATERFDSIVKYKCSDVFALDTYPLLKTTPCSVIMHSEDGPAVVRFDELSDETDALILAFLKDNQLFEEVQYKKGRFRFDISKDTTDSTEEDELD